MSRINAKQTKEELSKTPETDCCRAAFLSGLIHTAGAISFTGEGMRVIVEGCGLFMARPVFESVRCLFEGGVELSSRGRDVYISEVRADGKNVGNNCEAGGEKSCGNDCEPVGGCTNDSNIDNGKKDIKGGKIIISGGFVTDMLLELRILKLREGLSVVEGIDPYLVGEECCKRAYLAGAFLGGGALSAARGYHLEFACTSKKLRDDIMRLLSDFEIKSAAIVRGDKHIAYIKNKEMISDCLAFMGAPKSVLQLNLIMAERNLNSEVSRTANCDMANLSRLVEASQKQCEAIGRLKGIQDIKLRETAEARLKNPDVSYKELAVMLGISKGALKYRLERLMELAQE